MIRGMATDMNEEQLLTLADLQGFLDGTVAMDFAVAADERYKFIAGTAGRFGYARLNWNVHGAYLIDSVIDHAASSGFLATNPYRQID